MLLRKSMIFILLGLQILSCGIEGAVRERAAEAAAGPTGDADGEADNGDDILVRAGRCIGEMCARLNPWRREAPARRPGEGVMVIGRREGAEGGGAPARDAVPAAAALIVPEGGILNPHAAPGGEVGALHTVEPVDLSRPLLGHMAGGGGAGGDRPVARRIDGGPAPMERRPRAGAVGGDADEARSDSTESL